MGFLKFVLPKLIFAFKADINKMISKLISISYWILWKEQIAYRKDLNMLGLICVSLGPT